MERYAITTWNGSGKDGKGKVTSKSGAVKDAFYTAKTRFGEDPGTNPEELVAAAHASCFTMKVAFLLSEAGFTADNLETRCDIKFNNDNTAIAESSLTIKGRIQGITKEKFEEVVEDARKNCPISKSLNTNIRINANAILEEHELV